MSMDAFLAEHYGTKQASAATQEDLEKQASVDLFLRLAEEQKIKLAEMSDTQVQELYDNWVKAASAPETDPAETERQQKVAEAEREHAEKKAYAEKVAEADFLGRVMAHSYAQELRKIAGEMPPQFEKKEGEKKEEKKEEKEEKKEGAARLPKLASASALDQLAVEQAMVLAKGAGLDPQVAGQKVAAVLTLGLLGDSVKVASAPNVETATYVRALELLEKAGYPVQWAQS